MSFVDKGGSVSFVNIRGYTKCGKLGATGECSATRDAAIHLYPEWSRSIESDPVRAAFFHLVGIAASSKRFMCHAQWKGEIRDFRFIDIASGEQPHSFITNQQWLLF